MRLKILRILSLFATLALLPLEGAAQTPTTDWTELTLHVRLEKTFAPGAQDGVLDGVSQTLSIQKMRARGVQEGQYRDETTGPFPPQTLSLES